MNTIPETAEALPSNDPKANPDPLTGEPGSHPVGTGAGAAGAGLAGAALGAVGGPIAAVAGAVIGAVMGGLVGKGFGEGLNPTVEDEYWRENHAKQLYATGPDADFDAYAPAYRTGYEGYPLQADARKSFDDAESELSVAYQSRNARIPWDKARTAARAAWDRIDARQRESAAAADKT